MDLPRLLVCNVMANVLVGYRLMDRYTGEQVGGKIEKVTERWRGTERERETEREGDRERETERQRERYI